MNKAALLSALLLIAACSQQMHRGNFTLVSTESVSNDTAVISDVRIHGRACFSTLDLTVFAGDEAFEAAIADALGAYAGANVLIDVQSIDKGDCIEVNGLPGRI